MILHQQADTKYSIYKVSERNKWDKHFSFLAFGWVTSNEFFFSLLKGTGPPLPLTMWISHNHTYEGIKYQSNSYFDIIAS